MTTTTTKTNKPAGPSAGAYVSFERFDFETRADSWLEGYDKYPIERRLVAPVRAIGTLSLPDGETVELAVPLTQSERDELMAVYNKVCARLFTNLGQFQSEESAL